MSPLTYPLNDSLFNGFVRVVIVDAVKSKAHRRVELYLARGHHITAPRLVVFFVGLATDLISQKDG